LILLCRSDISQKAFFLTLYHSVKSFIISGGKKKKVFVFVWIWHKMSIQQDFCNFPSKLFTSTNLRQIGILSNDMTAIIEISYKALHADWSHSERYGVSPSKQLQMGRTVVVHSSAEVNIKYGFLNYFKFHCLKLEVYKYTSWHWIEFEYGFMRIVLGNAKMGLLTLNLMDINKKSHLMDRHG
jgi:hypothetical protein